MIIGAKNVLLQQYKRFMMIKELTGRLTLQLQ